MLKHNLQSLYINPEMFQCTATPSSGGSFNTCKHPGPVVKMLSRSIGTPTTARRHRMRKFLVHWTLLFANKSNLCAALSSWNTTENSSINSHAQDTNFSQSILSGTKNKLLFTNTLRSNRCPPEATAVLEEVGHGWLWKQENLKCILLSGCHWTAASDK
jgi:hypothetical protein